VFLDEALRDADAPTIAWAIIAASKAFEAGG